MPKRAWLAVLVCLVALCPALPAWAADVYVSEAGDNSDPGTQAKPLKSLWKAIKAAKAGDTIHVAEGNYPGQGKSGCMPRLEISNLKLLGGYSQDFKARDPFAHPTTIIAPADSRNKCRESTFKTEPNKLDLDGIVIDGFVIDRAPLNTYLADGSLDGSKSPSEPAIQLTGKGGFVVSNNVIVNSSWWGIYVKSGKDSKVTNNVVFISVGRAIEVIPGGGWGNPKYTIENNTCLFSYKLRSTEGRGVSLTNRTAYRVAANLLAFNDESGVAAKFAKELKVELVGNRFSFNKVGDLVAGGQGGLAVMADEFADELELPKIEANQKVEPKLPIDKAWFDKYLARKDAAEGKVTHDDLNNLRSSLGMPLVGGPGTRATHYAVRYPGYQDALKLVGLVAGAGAQKVR